MHHFDQKIHEPRRLTKSLGKLIVCCHACKDKTTDDFDLNGMYSFMSCGFRWVKIQCKM
jgi:hypothetical protein